MRRLIFYLSCFKESADDQEMDLFLGKAQNPSIFSNILSAEK